jgi:hypothetical protein
MIGATIPLMPPMSTWSTKRVTFLADPPIENVSSPACEISTFTSRGLNVGATIETVVFEAFRSMWFSNVVTRPFATSTGSFMRSLLVLSFPSSV